jgi:hypothetical protein
LRRSGGWPQFGTSATAVSESRTSLATYPGFCPPLLVKCAERELGLRQMVYPRKVATRKMSLVKARHEIKCMQRTIEILKEMEIEHSRKLKLSA